MIDGWAPQHRRPDDVTRSLLTRGHDARVAGDLEQAAALFGEGLAHAVAAGAAEAEMAARLQLAGVALDARQIDAVERLPGPENGEPWAGTRRDTNQR